MKRVALLGAVVALWLAHATPASAHPVPFSYLDLDWRPGVVHGTLVVHILDVAHDLGIEPAERLLDPGVAAAFERRIGDLIARRLALTLDGRRATAAWSGIEVLADRDALRLGVEIVLDAPAGHLAVEGRLFPYDSNHRTFVNVFEGAGLSQAILDDGRLRAESFAGTRQGRLAVVRTFIPAGVEHILIGPDHILFLVGLLLLGGTLRRLAWIVTGFTVAHSVTLSLAALNILSPPARLIEPIIALSIIYVGLDNLLVRREGRGRDMRAWIALAFGLVHGFGFASVLREVGLPAGALGWSLLSFNVGVELGQLVVVAGVATAVAAVRARSETVGQRLVFAGSIAVIAMGGFWFVERIAWLGGS
jgi:hydrogenase/urease accessory protein HupE